MVSSQATPVKIRMLGSFEVGYRSRTLPVNAWPRKKAAALLQRLAYERRLVKEQAIEFLWPESSLISGLNNLYRVLYALRQTIDASLGPGIAERVFSFEDGVLRLAEDVWVDAAEFERLCKAVPGEEPEQRVARLREALALYQGEFLPDERFEEWTLLPRETLTRLQREATLTLAKHHLGREDYPAAIDLLRPLLVRDAADEPVHRNLMRAYALSGRRHDALRQYQACVDALAAELDVPPSPETTALYDQILSGALGPPAARPRPAPVDLARERPSFFAGRQAEMAALAAILRAAGGDRGRTVFIAGESGIGKTRLALEALRVAAHSGAATLSGAAYEQEGRLPFQPFIEAFDHFLAQKGRPLKENPITHFQRPNTTDLQQEHWALFKATANFLLEIARDTPLVFLVDDLHAADETSLQLFHYLARQTRSAPVVLIATYRIDSPARTPLNSLVTSLYREGLSETVLLESLPKATVQEILENILPGKVSDELCQAVFEIAAGNPFYVQEIARALLKLEMIERVGASWSLKRGVEMRVPDTLGAFLHQRVSRLGAGVEAVLTAAAVIGRQFNFEILRFVASRLVIGQGPASNGEILDALDAALAGYLIEETPAGYRFRHPLIRRTLYERLSRVRRAHLHTMAAEAIEAVSASRPGGIAQQVEALAYHYDLSDRRDRALPYLIQTGEHAAGVYAFEVAIDAFERALRLMDDLGLPDPAARWRLLESLGSWHAILADTSRAVERFEQALALEAGPDWQPAGRDRVRLHCGAAVALITAGEMDAAERHLQMALPLVDEREAASEYAHLYYTLAQLHWHRNEYRQAFAVAQRSLAIAERLNQREAIARAFEILALACHSLGEWKTGMTYEQQRAELAGAELDVSDAFDVHL